MMLHSTCVRTRVCVCKCACRMGVCMFVCDFVKEFRFVDKKWDEPTETATE